MASESVGAKGACLPATRVIGPKLSLEPGAEAHPSRPCSHSSCCDDAAAQMFTCVVVPMRIAFPAMFDEDVTSEWKATSWNIIDIFIEWYFVLGVVLNFFTGYWLDGRLITKVTLISRKYVVGWFWVDMISSIPVDTICAYESGACEPLIRLNKVLRVLRLYKVVGMIRRSKYWQSKLDPAMMKLFELIFFLVLAWHYIGSLWWYVGDAYGRPVVERLRVLDVNLHAGAYELPAGDPLLTDSSMHYLAGFHWAIMMTVRAPSP